VYNYASRERDVIIGAPKRGPKYRKCYIGGVKEMEPGPGAKENSVIMLIPTPKKG
jgi:hypothetical protein